MFDITCFKVKLELINCRAGNLAAIVHSIELIHRPDVSVDASLNSKRLSEKRFKDAYIFSITRLESRTIRGSFSKEYALLQAVSVEIKLGEMFLIKVS